MLSCLLIIPHELLLLGVRLRQSSDLGASHEACCNGVRSCCPPGSSTRSYCVVKSEDCSECLIINSFSSKAPAYLKVTFTDIINSEAGRLGEKQRGCGHIFSSSFLLGQLWWRLFLPESPQLDSLELSTPLYYDLETKCVRGLSMFRKPKVRHDPCCTAPNDACFPVQSR